MTCLLHPISAYIGRGQAWKPLHEDLTQLNDTSAHIASPQNGSCFRMLDALKEI